MSRFVVADTRPPAVVGQRAEHVWAVLDCPTYFAAYHDAPDPLLSQEHVEDDFPHDIDLVHE